MSSGVRSISLLICNPRSRSFKLCLCCVCADSLPLRIVIQTEVRPSMSAAGLVAHCLALYRRQNMNHNVHESLLDAGNYNLRICDEDGSLDDDYPALDDLATLSSLVPFLEKRSSSTPSSSQRRSSVLYRQTVEGHFALTLRDPSLLDLLKHQQQQQQQRHHTYTRRKTSGGGEMIESMHRYRLYQWCSCCHSGWDESESPPAQPQSKSSRLSRWLCCS